MRIQSSTPSRISSQYYFYLAALAWLALIFIPVDTANARSNFTTGDCLQIQDTPDNPFSDGLQGDPNGGEGKQGHQESLDEKESIQSTDERPASRQFIRYVSRQWNELRAQLRQLFPPAKWGR